MTAGQAPEPGPAAGRTVLDALARVLRPLVRLLIARSIPFPVAAEALRRLYVEIASDDFAVEGKRQTDSRINLLTGVHRKDVRRLREERSEPAVAPRKASLTSVLIARWTTLDEYRAEDGRPKPLPKSESGETKSEGGHAGREGGHAGREGGQAGREGGGTSFEALVRSVNTDIRPRVVLDEWQRLGIAHVDEEQRVHLHVDAFVPPKESDEILHFLGHNAGAHLAAAVHNVLGAGEPFFERAASYDQLTPDSVAELREMAGERGMDALRAVNRRAMALQRKDSGKSQATQRMSFGAYFYSEDAHHEEVEDVEETDS